jgi:HK97 family phage portal protein
VANFLTKPIHLPWDGAIQKAASLALPQPRRRGGYVGDPITSGYWVDADRWGMGWRANGTFDYAQAVGRPDQTSIVRGCLRALNKAVAEPPPRLYRPNAEGEMDRIKGRPPLEKLLLKPNPSIRSRRLLAMWECAALHLDGNAYYWKQRSEAGRLLALWPLPPAKVGVVPGETTATYVSHYLYKPNDREEPMRLRMEDVLHLKLELDPDEPWRGRSPVQAVLKHIFTDEEATAFCNAMLKNYGVPSALISPAPTTGAGGLAGPPMPKEQAERFKEQWMAATGGDRRGEPVVMGHPMQVDTVSFNPQQMLLDKLQLLPETRICSAFGVPPIIAYFQAGLNNATYSNAEQFQAGFVLNTMVPYWTLVGEQYTHDLVPEFYGAGPGGRNDADEEIRYDLTEVRALQEDENQKHERIFRAVGGPYMTVNDGRRDVGLPELPEEVMYIPSTVTPTDPDQLIPEPEPEPPAVPLLEAPGASGAPGANGAAPAPPVPAQAAAAAAQQNGRAR